LGGQVLVNGRSQWVDVAHPLHRAESIARWWITTGSLATSGNSERGRTIDGIRIGHVLDARTGQPAEDFGSVTVWCDNALDADCLSTALFALGPEKGLQLAATLPNVRALFAVHQGDGVQLRATSNCRPFLRSQQTILWFPEPQANDPVPEETENKTR
jgi:thiamine biosynthesis lipoprotein